MSTKIFCGLPDRYGHTYQPGIEVNIDSVDTILEPGENINSIALGRKEAAYIIPKDSLKPEDILEERSKKTHWMGRSTWNFYRSHSGLGIRGMTPHERLKYYGAFPRSIISCPTPRVCS